MDQELAEVKQEASKLRLELAAALQKLDVYRFTDSPGPGKLWLQHSTHARACGPSVLAMADHCLVFNDTPCRRGPLVGLLLH